MVLRFHYQELNETVFIIMALYGYTRVSTSDQGLTLQTQILRAAVCEIIRAEKASGSSRTGRSELQLLLKFLRPGDTLMVTRVDRLACSIKDLQDIVYTLNQQGVMLRVTEQSVDTRTAAGKTFLDMPGVFAEFETSLRREHQMEGIPTTARCLPSTLPSSPCSATCFVKGYNNFLLHSRVFIIPSPLWLYDLRPATDGGCASVINGYAMTLHVLKY